MAILGGTLIDGTGRPPIHDSSIVLGGGRIIASGRRGEVEVPRDAEIIDASRGTVLPGFIDAHTHFLWMGIGMVRFVDMSSAQSLSEALSQVGSRLKMTPMGEWVLGRGWDESKWPEKRYITKEDIDPFSPHHPVMLTRVDGHLVTLNSKALELAGITRDTPDPPGGRIDRDPSGDPTGILRDARQLVERVIPPPTMETALEGLRRACDLALSLGCTGIHDAGLDPFGLEAYQTALDRGILKLRAYLMVRGDAAKASEALGIRTGFGCEFLKLGSVKLIMDGSLGARTAALFEPYEDDPSTRGLLVSKPEELEEEARRAHGRGFQIAIHAIGDRGIEHSINIIEKVLRESPRRDHRHRIEHCEVLTTTQIERLRQLGIIASMQPNFVGEWSGPGGMYEARLGAERLRLNNPYRALLDEEVHVAFGSDCMPFNPIYGLWSAVNHPIRESRIGLVEAVRCYTLEAAYAAFMEELTGSIEPGKLADIVILDEDLTKIRPERIREVKVRMTIVNGKILYAKD
jgi:predicted amidohydrolase YtcJ